MVKSKWAIYDAEIDARHADGDIEENGYAPTARDILGENASNEDVDLFRTYIKRRIRRIDGNDYTINSNNEGYTVVDGESELSESILDYCKRYNINPAHIKSYKFINHQGQEAYNIALDPNIEKFDTIDWDAVKKSIKTELSEFKYKPKKIQTNREKVGILKIADLHLGAYIDDLILSRKFSIDSIVTGFEKTVQILNEHNYSTVHVHILGDLIESFTGLNHMNSWKGLDKGMHGAEAVKLVTQILHESLLKHINNLGEVKLVAGNHDRVTSRNDEDVHGDAANLVAWGLELIGYDIEFNPLVITHVVDGIAHVLTHGHHGISKMQTKELIWDYGVKGKFNYVCEGHLHSRIQKLSSTQRKKFTTIMDDAIDHKRHILPSYFTGNFYSESNGWTTTPGFVIVEDNGEGLPNTFDYSL